MYSKLVLLCLVATGLAAPATDVVPLEKQQPTVIPILSQSEELENNGTYKFSYETGNGIKREETSYDKVLPKLEGQSAAGDSNEGGESEESNEAHVQQGSYSYTAPDGTVISVRYIADENGFRPVGDHIPPSIVAAAAAAGSSGEKSGRALNVADSANSASAPKPAVAPAAKPIPEPAESAPEPKSKKTEATESAETSTTEADKETKSVATTANASEATTANVSEATPSTTEAGATSSEATDASEASTPAEATTKSGDATTAASAEPSSTSAEASTTEATSTTAA